MKNKGEDLFPTIIPRIGIFHIRHVHATYSLQFIQKMWYSTAPFFNRPWWSEDCKKALTGGDVKEGIKLYLKLYEALLRTKANHIHLCKCEEGKVVEVGYGNKKEKYTTIDELTKGVSSESFGNVIVSVKIESLPNSVQGDTRWFMDTNIELVDMLLNYIRFLGTGNWKRYLKSSLNFPIASL